MTLNIIGRLSCIKHKILSYGGTPTIPTNLPADEAVPLFEESGKAEEFRNKLPRGQDKYECEELKTMEDFVFFLQCINQQGIQYAIVNPIAGQPLPNSIFHIGRLLAQNSGGKSFGGSGQA